LSDPDGQVGRQFGVWDDVWRLERRVTFIVDKARRIRYIEQGRPAIETNRALEALTELATAK
jgi:peroxiredoxin